MPSIRDKETREKVIKSAGGELNYPTQYLQPKDGESKLLSLVREYEGTSAISRFFASFTPFGKAAKLKREFDKAGFGDEKRFSEEIAKIERPNTGLATSSTTRSSEYGSISAALSSQIPEQVYGPAPVLPPRESIYSSVGVVFKDGTQASASLPSSTGEYGPAPTLSPVYDKVPPISAYGSVKDLEENPVRRPAPATPPQFFDAVKAEDITSVRDMLDNHPDLLNARNERGNTALEMAKQQGNIEMARHIEGKGKFAQMIANKSSAGSGMQK